jgi:hypothetical protein
VSERSNFITVCKENYTFYCQSMVSIPVGHLDRIMQRGRLGSAIGIIVEYPESRAAPMWTHSLAKLKSCSYFILFESFVSLIKIYKKVNSNACNSACYQRRIGFLYVTLSVWRKVVIALMVS